MDGLIEKYNGLIYSIIQKYGSLSDREDLYEVGVLGLINAYKRYKTGSKFSTYAYYYILGEVTKYLREKNGINLTYDDIKLNKKINEYIEKYKSIKGKVPTYEEIERDLEIPKKKIIDIENSINYINRVDIDENRVSYNENQDEIIDLKNSFKYLTESEKQIIRYHYYEGYTEKEIGEKLGITQVEVSRNKAKILKKLRAYN